MGRYVQVIAIIHSEQCRLEHRQKKARLKKICALMRVTLRERQYLTASALISPSKSPRSFMHAAGDDGAFMVTVSLPVFEFNILLAAFARHYTVKSGPGKRGDLHDPKTKTTF
ncbi:hypothetical protein PC116_g22526 [Phytophthora cactorum]|uniref:Uncharacterized protein n=1 Tax=Phytophthora cactorum TaxID=29920 RepID=A0A8T1K4R8_9STRA|nr:hypothetical protein Pcac1_g15910 [Phytophthora cactorum]KAG2884437.1 hypothetical protein PC114_g20090 [Phytophthora cactorum]KAG2909243.1 hypothetical protein PC117_g19728 [Phytophthora cactorum]KAG2987771.1 hypothetical protein PC119_g19607 [Phytophthora cactorum]KAG2995289.1 hypothetical protein PC120_g21796 [Phytophthora cactorum]